VKSTDIEGDEPENSEEQYMCKPRARALANAMRCLFGSAKLGRLIGGGLARLFRSMAAMPAMRKAFSLRLTGENEQ
jgi:hypothetical protein